MRPLPALPLLLLARGVGVMHAARVDQSRRLQRVLAVLEDNREHSTRAILSAARVCAVNSIVAELRANGYFIACRQMKDADGGRVWLYHLVNGPRSQPETTRA